MLTKSKAQSLKGIKDDISGNSTSLIYTKQINLNGYIGANIKGIVL